MFIVEWYALHSESRHLRAFRERLESRYTADMLYDGVKKDSADRNIAAVGLYEAHGSKIVLLKFDARAIRGYAYTFYAACLNYGQPPEWVPEDTTVMKICCADVPGWAIVKTADDAQGLPKRTRKKAEAPVVAGTIRITTPMFRVDGIQELVKSGVWPA